MALALYSPAKGAQVVTAVGDYSGFVHWDLDKPAPGGSPKPPFLGNTHDVSGSDANPKVMVRVGRPCEGKAIGYSTEKENQVLLGSSTRPMNGMAPVGWSRRT